MLVVLKLWCNNLQVQQMTEISASVVAIVINTLLKKFKMEFFINEVTQQETR